MATIQNAVNLTDNMSSVLAKIERNSRAVEKALNDVNRVNLNPTKAMALSNQLKTLKRDTDLVASSMSQLNKTPMGGGEATAQIRNLSGSVKELTRDLKGVNEVRLRLGGIDALNKSVSDAKANVRGLSDELANIKSPKISVGSLSIPKVAPIDSSSADSLANRLALAKAETLRLNTAVSNINREMLKSPKYISSMLTPLQRVKSLANATAYTVGNGFRNLGSQIAAAGSTGENFVTKLRHGLSLVANSIYIVKNAVNALSEAMENVDKYTTTMARLKMTSDGLKTAAQYNDDIYAAARRSRGAYNDMADSVSKIQLLAGESFKKTGETIKFAETMNKMFAVSGATAQMRSSAWLQLTQALSADKLQGDEFRSITENAPLLIDAIMKYTGKGRAEIKKMSTDGVLGAQIIKNAILAYGSEADKMFKQMPRTFSQTITQMQNDISQGLIPIKQALSELGSSEQFQQVAFTISNTVVWIANTIAAAIPVIQQFATTYAWAIQIIGIAIIVSLIPSIAAWIQSHFALIAVIFVVVGVLAVLWWAISSGNYVIMTIVAIVLGLIAIWLVFTAVANIVAVANGIIAFSFMSVIFPIIAIIVIIGLLVGAIFYLWDTNMDFRYGFLEIWWGISNGLSAANLVILMGFNKIVEGAYAMGVGVAAIIDGMINNIIDGINNLTSAINSIFGLSIAALNHINLTATATAKLVAVKARNEKQVNDAMRQHQDQLFEQKVIRANRPFEEAKAKEKRNAIDNFVKTAKGYVGKGLTPPDMPKAPEAPKVPDVPKFSPDMYGSGAKPPKAPSTKVPKTPKTPKLKGGKLDEVGKINTDVDIANEDLKYLKDIATQKYVNKYTTLSPTVQVTFGDVHETADVGKIEQAIESMIVNAYANSMIT